MVTGEASFPVDKPSELSEARRKARIGRRDTLEQTAKLIEDFLDA